MQTLSIDYETRSTVDLTRAGAHVYAAHETTDILCMAYAFGDEEPSVWVPGDTPPERILDHVLNGGPIRAWNFAFEKAIWRSILAPRYLFPEIDPEQGYCTAAEAAAMALPRKLEQAAQALGLPTQKDMAGHRLMMQMARPRSTKGGIVTWWDDPDKLARLIEYCRQDVRVEREIAKRVRPLSDHERQIYLLDQRINDRGVRIDVPLAKAAQALVEEGMRRANAEMDEITGGSVSAVTKVADLTRWLQAEGGVDADNVRKDTLRDLLGGDELDPVTRRVVELRAESAKSSTSKIKAMLKVAAVDDRARGLLLYHGAGTGRWAGRLIQPQNFPRGEIKGVEQFIPTVLAGDYDGLAEHHPPLLVVSSLLRGMLRASEGHRLMAGDYGQIEARVLAWIAEQNDLVAAFAAGAKIYEEMAALIYGLPAGDIGRESDERQIGKTTILGAGFGMGHVTFQAQTKKQTGIDLDDETAQRAIEAYRARYARIPKFWRAIYRAAEQAVKRPGTVTSVGRRGAIRYVVRGQFLWCILPSGRPLAYAKPEIRPWKTSWGEVRPTVTFVGVDGYTKKWRRQGTYGGHLTENVVQAMARDLMASAMLRLEQKGYPVVLTVHDELVADVPEGFGSIAQYKKLMAMRPRWAEGLPVAVDGWEGERYKK